MRFSIIVPIYKVENYLRQCIESILTQDYTDYELLLIDDGSPDSSPTICDEYASKDSRVKVVHKKNGGLVSARKAGAEIAQGDYILNVDGDDWIEEGYLSKIENAIIASNNADIIAWGYTEKGTSLEKVHLHKLPEGLYLRENLERIRGIYLYDKSERGSIFTSIIISIWSKAVKRELYVKNQLLIDERINKGEDAILVFRLLLQAKSVYIMKYAKYMYRIIDASMSHKLNIQDFKILEILIDELRKFVPEEYMNQVRCYALFRLMDLFTLAARSCDYKTFKTLIKKNLNKELLLFALKGKIYKKRVQEVVKLMLLKIRAWRFLYTILKKYEQRITLC